MPKFDQLNGDSITTGVMKQLFRRHRVDTVFGLALLHKHSLLREGERLTEVRGISNPLTFEVGHPSVWKCKSDDRQLVPLEFSIEPCDINWQNSNIQAFLAEFSELLAKLGAG